MMSGDASSARGKKRHLIYFKILLKYKGVHGSTLVYMGVHGSTGEYRRARGSINIFYQTIDVNIFHAANRIHY